MAGQTLIQVLDTGCIDWSAGVVRVNGTATPATDDGARLSGSTPDTLDAARLQAQSNLLQTVDAIRINADFRVVDRAADDAVFRQGLHALVQNASLTRQEYLSDGTVELELTMNLTGGFGQFVLPEEIRQVDSVTTMTTAQPGDGPPTAVAKTKSGTYTGLILDATGVGLRPSMAPLVVDESGEVVYGPAFVSREFAVSRGMCGFATTLAAARNDKRVGERPLIIKALNSPSTKETDLVISSADASRLRSSVVHLNFLKACRVSIVVDPTTNACP